MANHKQALKRHRQSLVQQARNRFYKRTMASSIKNAEAAHSEDTKEEVSPEDAQQLLRRAISTIARVAAKGVIPKKRAARKIARLTKLLQK